MYDKKIIDEIARAKRERINLERRKGAKDKVINRESLKTRGTWHKKSRFNSFSVNNRRLTL